MILSKGADQTARMRKLVCAVVVPKLPKTGFLTSRPIHGSSNFSLRVAKLLPI